MTGRGSYFRNANNPGHLVISGYSFFNSLTGSGTLLNLRFHVIGAPGQSTALTFEDYTDPGSRIHQAFLFNEGTPSVITSNGSVTALAGPTLTPTNSATSTNTPTPTSTPTATSTASPSPTNTPVYPYVTVTLPIMAAVQASTISVPVTLSDTTGLGVVSFDLNVSFDPAVMTPASPAFDSTGTLSSGMSITPNGSTPGHLIISAFQGTPVSGAGTLINLRFNIVGAPGQATILAFENFAFNGSIPVPLITYGSVTIAADLTPTPTYTGTPLATATATPVASPVIGGQVKYGNIIAAPGTRPISDVLIDGVGPVPVSDLTDAFGFYELGGLGFGLYDVTPSKTTGTGLLGSITAFDAGMIAQRVAGVITLNVVQRFVGDVSNSGSVTSFDAAMIAGFVAGPPYPPTGIGWTSAWRFAPSLRTYTGVTSVIANQNYIVYLGGEVSGNWGAAGPRPAGGGSATPIYLRRSSASPEPSDQNSAAVPPAAQPQDSDGQSSEKHSFSANRAAEPPVSGGPERGIAVELPNLVSAVGKDIVVPVNVQGIANKGIIAYEFDLRYDPSVIQPRANPVDLAGTVSRGLSVVANSHEPGLLRVVVYGAIPVDSNGVLLNLRFVAVGTVGSASPLMWERFMFNEGEPRVSVTNGEVRIGN